MIHYDGAPHDQYKVNEITQVFHKLELLVSSQGGECALDNLQHNQNDLAAQGREDPAFI